MSIRFDETTQNFYLETPNTSYIIGIVEDKYLFHAHYGEKINFMPSCEKLAKAHTSNYAVINSDSYDKLGLCGDNILLEFSTFDSGDYRTPSFHAQYENGGTVTQLWYNGYKILKGKPALKGLPATYTESDDEATTLEIYLKDEISGLEAVLCYTTFQKYDAIARSVRYINNGKECIRLKSVMSATVDMPDMNYEFINLAGSWARERHINKTKLAHTKTEVSSAKGTTSHIQNNFIALARPDTTEESGEVYGFSLVYSGNFVAGVDVNGQDTTRVYMGINPHDFCWKLNPGEDFQSPEAILVYSADGLGKMSRTYHSLYRNRICRGKYRDSERPVLINNWEATYFGFDEDKIAKIAEKAKTADIDLMVLDDGWFGKRNDDTTSLGDWFEDKNKLPKGLDSLAKRVNGLGMRFGLWFEPEMISEDSDLFRAHPDWCIATSGRAKSLGRHQYVLDLSRKEVCDYIVDAVCSVLGRANITYVKWDMNRYISEFGSCAYPADQQGEIAHRYVLGLYDVLDRITSAFPDVLFEGCSGGGGRFDPAMLYYSPQIWTSDNSDAVERMYIQHGTSMVYPASAMGAHVSAVPNHQVGRTTPISLRGNVAMAGQFGYELDLNKLSEEDFNQVVEQVKFYKRIRKTVHYGDMYRIRSPFDKSTQDTAWQFVSEDKKQIVLFDYTMDGKANPVLDHIKLQGLDVDALYELEETGEMFGGDYLMHFGITTVHAHDYDSKVYVFNRK